MFYSNQILARKGPLGLVWIAAHLDRQLKRQQINNTSIAASVDTLLDPEVPLALRLSGQLLLGVVRIYARKVNYLQQDCNDALVKIRVALKAADGVNLPPGSQTAPVESITILGPRAAARSSKGRTAAAAGAAGASGSGNVEDAFEIGLDDLYWEQDVMVGGSSGFGGLDFGGIDLGLAPSCSGPLSQDISGVFGMASTDDDQQELFDMEDEEAAALWDLDDLEVERLRAAPSQQMSDGGGLSGLVDPSVTPGVAGPAGKGAETHSPGSTGAAAAAAGDGLMTQPASTAGDEPSQGAAETPGAAAAAADAVDQGSAGSPGGLGYTGGSLDLVAALPPTPATAGSGPSGAGPSPVRDLQDLLPATPHSDLAAEQADAAAAGSGAAGTSPAPQQEGGEGGEGGGALDMMEVDLPAAADDDQTQDPQATAQTGDEHGANHAAAAGVQPAKTFQRRATRQQEEQRQQEPSTGSGAAAGDGAASPATGAAAAADDKAAKKAAAKAARQRRTSALLGHKRRVVIDDYDMQPAGAASAAAADGSGGSRRRSSGAHAAAAAAAAAANKDAPTELPQAEVGALRKNRAPLLDKSRGQAMQMQLRAAQTAAHATAHLSLLPLPLTQPLSACTEALASGSPAKTAAAAAAAAAVAAAFGTANNLPLNAGGRSAAFTALLGGVCGTSTGGTRAASNSCAAAGVAEALCMTTSAGGLPLPPELQGLFTNATAAAADVGPVVSRQAPAMDHTNAVAPLASLEEIGVVEDMEFLDAEVAGGGGLTGPASRLNPGAATRRSLALSLVSTPGLQHHTPGTVQQPGAGGVAGTGTGADGEGSARSGGLSAGCSGFGGPAGFDGYTPGSFAGITPGAAAADAAGPVAAGEDDRAGVLQDIHRDDVMMTNQDAAFTQHLPEDLEQQFVEADGSDKENEGGLELGGAGKPAVAAKADGHGAAAGLGFGSSGRSTQEAMMPWPADAENLVEQAGEDGGDGVADGGFTSRTRLVLRRLQHAAANAAAAGDGSSGLAGLAAAGTPAIGSKRRISAAPPPSSGKATTGQQQQEQQQVSLSFQSLTQGYSRLDACRCFYEVLVLGNKGLVKLEQQESYGDIRVTPDLAAMARV